MNELVPHKHERLALSAVILGGIMALVFGFAYLGKSIVDPLRLKPQTFKTQEQQDTEKMAALRTQDTDHDGLNDYDELYVYHTSPYLPDSDSDGYSDKQEIESGNDPSCPAKQDCGHGTSTATITNPDGSNTQVTQPSDIIPPTVDPSFFQPPVADASGGSVTNLTPAQLRDLLVQNGIPKEQVDALDDQTLLDLYQQSFMQVQQLQSMSATGDNSSTTDITSMTPAQLRQLLIQSGVSKEQVDAIDDQTLLELYQQTLQQTLP